MPVIELAAVHKRYGDVHALTDVDLTVEPGEVVALLGPNGAGKTTAFELLLGLGVPSSGTVEVFGRRPDAVRDRVGVMLQGAGLPELVTVRELVTLIARSYPWSLPVDEALARTGLTERSTRRLGDLSGGERQRVLLAAAIAAAPDLLLLDEPTAAMDVDARRSFWEQARSSVRDGATIVFATHDLGEADAIADRVVVLQQGRIVADTTPSGLKRRVSGSTVVVTTDAPVEEVRALAGVRGVDLDAADPAVHAGMHRLRIRAVDAEQVVVPLARAGRRLHELTVTAAGLEDAFLDLTTTAPAATDATDTTGSPDALDAAIPAGADR